MKSTTGAPIELDFKSAGSSGSAKVTPGDFSGFQSLRTFSSYSFDKNILVPASAFRFTAPGVDKKLRTSIRSGDMIELFAVNSKNDKLQIATGFVDETDTHVNGSTVEYVITGRDTIGQLIDNAAVDKDNRIVHMTKWRLSEILDWLIRGTRIPEQSIIRKDVPNSELLFQINPGETKINTLQRYLEFCNCLVWSTSTGQAVIGKPNFIKETAGKLILDRLSPGQNNIIEARVRRNVNTAIRQIVTIIQAASKIDVSPFTVNNADPDVAARAGNLVGRSVLRTFPYGAGNDLINVIQQVGKSASPYDIGHALSFREIARENMKVLDLEIVVKGHTNENDDAYDIDQVYDVNISDDDVAEPMYVYACTYNLTPDHGIMTTLRLCRLHTIVGYSEELRRH